jgi:hypothetical protein
LLVVMKEAEVGMVVAFISGLTTVRDPWGDLVLWFQNLMVTRTKYRLIAEALDRASAPPPDREIEATKPLAPPIAPSSGFVEHAAPRRVVQSRPTGSRRS